MFKKPLADLKTSAPLRSSDRRKLKQRVVETYSLSPEVGDLLVPEGLLTQNDPLWFTLGKGSDELIPTVYTLWKYPELLPFLSTPSAVVPKLIGGADLMIPGVVQHSPFLHPNQLVSITQYHSYPKLGPPLAVGRMAVSNDVLNRSDRGDDVKGKAVHVLHTWKDHLWDMGNGRKMDVPAPREVVEREQAEGATENDAKQQPVGGIQEQIEDGTGAEDILGGTQPEASGSGTQTQPATDAARPVMTTLTPEDVSHCLRSALLQALQTTLKSLPPPSFPIPASTFWSTYILPSRPAYALGTNGLSDSNQIDIKHSTHKTVKTFLKAMAKEGLLKLKESKGDVLVTAVYPAHPAVGSHRPHRTVQSVGAQREKAEERERKEKEAEEKKKGEIQVIELWKPHGSTVAWFVAAGKDTSSLYTMPDIREIFNTYVSSKKLINVQEQQYINVGEDPALASAVSAKNEDIPEFMKREETLKRIRDHMQPWHETRVVGSDAVRKKGHVRPIFVTVKIRQGRKAATLISGFEPYLLQAEELAEELRKLCASATSVTPLPGKSSDLEVMVQGKQIKAVTDLLISKGVPKKWIEVADLSDAKKK
ncbi:unnamed protein product [Somion occarium]|uniref:Eukaryotic translation initiation factor SUI1 family protein n=1 Tax=Somion occarium TaxID=3059160 RepID=A0ABP1CQC5_9APHY